SSSAGSTSSDPTQPRPGTAASPVPEKKKSGTIAAVSAETVKPGMTVEELQTSVKVNPKATAEPTVKSEPAAKPEPVTSAKPDVTEVETNIQPSVRAGKICPNCAHANRPGVLICENCGTNLE